MLAAIIKTTVKPAMPAIARLRPFIVSASETFGSCDIVTSNSLLCDRIVRRAIVYCFLTELSKGTVNAFQAVAFLF